MRHQIRLFQVGVTAYQSEQRTAFLLAVDGFLYLFLVLGNQAVGGIDDVLRAAIVLLQLEQLRSWNLFTQVQDIADVSTTEGVDGLGIVTHHGEVFVLLGQLFDDKVLGSVGVLVLVHQHVAEVILIELQYVGMVAEQDIGIEQQIVEVHRSRLIAAVPVALVDFTHLGALGNGIVGHQFAVLDIHAGRDEVVLGIAYLAMYRVGLILLVVQSHLLDDSLDQGARVRLVVDGEVRAEANALSLTAQDATEERMEGAHPDAVRRLATHQLVDTLLHLGGSFLGESQGDDGVGRVAVLQQVGNLTGQNSGLARPGTCNN